MFSTRFINRLGRNSPLLTYEQKEIAWQHGCLVLKPAKYTENPEDISQASYQKLSVIVIPINDFDPSAKK